MSSNKGRHDKGGDREILFVSPEGNDAWSGKLPWPNVDETDGPFATVQRAQKAARACKVKGRQPRPVDIWLRGGTYFLSETWRFTPEDSGTAECPVTYRAFPGERPVLSGGQRISGWREGSVNGQACWIAEIPEVRQGKWYFTQLFVNGQRRRRARLPHEGYYRFAGLVAGDKDTGFNWLQGPQRAHYAGDDIRPFKNLDDVKIIVYQLWFDTHHRIRELDTAQRIVHFRQPSLGSLIDEKGESARYFVENILEGLGQPGDWYLDRADGLLYYIPMREEGRRPRVERMEAVEVIAPRLQTLVHFQGNERQRVAHIRLENISFQHADWDFPPDCPGYIQAASGVPGAIILERAEACVLYGCEVAHVGQYAVEVTTGSTRNDIVACHLHDMGAGGVKVGHEWMLRVNETNPEVIPPSETNPPSATRICDCTIHDGGHRSPSAIGVWIGNAGHNRVRYNHIFDLNYTGISDGWTWGYAPTATVDNRIEYNHIHHINHRQILSDNGGIYTLGIHPGGLIRSNLIHDIDCYGYGGWGIYPDEGSSEMLIVGNVVHHTKEAAFSVHYGRDLVVENNIFALSKDAHFRPGKAEDHRSAIIQGNLIYFAEGSLIHAEQWFPENYTFRDNLFYNANGPVEFGPTVSLEEWQVLGQLEGTVIADPLFCAAEAGNFCLRADSPAKLIAFDPVDTFMAGPRLWGTCSAAYEDWRALERDFPQEIVRTILELAEPPTLERGRVQGRVRVTLRNVGDLPSRGRVSLRAAVSGTVRFKARPRLDFDLQPGQEKSAEFAFTATPMYPYLGINTESRGAVLIPTRLLIRPDWPIRRLRRLKGVEEVAAALGDESPLPLRWATRRVGSVRAAVTGEYLALAIEAVDGRLELGQRVRERSCVQVCASKVDAPQQGWHHPNPGIGQVNLMPTVAGRAAHASQQQGAEEVPAPNVQVRSQPTAEGYALQALIPLALLKIGPEDGRFRLEVVLNGVFNPGDARRRATLFRAIWPEVDNRTYGFVRVK